MCKKTKTELLSIPHHIISPLHFTLPFLSNSFPLGSQDHDISDKHTIMKANQMYGSR